MSVKFDKLFALLEAKGLSKTYWLQKHGINPNIVHKLKHNKTMTTKTIAKICHLLDCQPGDIMEYTAEDEPEDGIRH